MPVRLKPATVGPASPRRRPSFDLTVAAVVLLFGAVLAVVIPPLGGFDEPLHFVRAWQVSDGRVIPHQIAQRNGAVELYARVPTSLPVEMRAILRDGLVDAHDAQFVYSHLGDAPPHGSPRWQALEGAGDYSPVPYLPSAIAIRVGRALGLSTLAMIELARLAQVFAYAVLIGLAVRRIKYRTAVVAVLTLAPVALIEVGTLSADPLTTALTLLVIAEASSLLSRPSEEIGLIQLGEVAAALIALGLAKPPYVLVAAFLIVPMWRHRGRVAVGLAAGMVAAAGLTIAWSRWAQDHFVLLNGGVAQPGVKYYTFHNVAPSNQARFVRAHPRYFLATIGRTLAHFPGELLHDAFAQSSSWRPPGLAVLLVLVLLSAAFAVSPEPLPGGRAMRLLGTAVSIALFVTLFYLAYAGWNAVGAPRIDAFQGRYLLPVVAVAALVAIGGMPPRVRIAEHVRDRAAMAVVAGSGAIALWCVVGIVRFFYF